jgi:hypothetical protein
MRPKHRKQYYDYPYGDGNNTTQMVVYSLFSYLRIIIINLINDRDEFIIEF